MHLESSGGIWSLLESSTIIWRHPGDTQETPGDTRRHQETPGDTRRHQETLRRHSGSTLEAPRRHLGVPRSIQEHPGSPRNTQETPRRHPGDTQETPRRPQETPGDSQETPRRHPEGTQDTPRGTKGSRRHFEVKSASTTKFYNKTGATERFA